MPKHCRGEPNHADYYEWDEDVSVYAKRHSVLFNLYAMDALHATVDFHDPPRLKVTNCNFIYFLNDYEALVLVETANFAQRESDGLVFLMGEDRGADIILD
jgi:hypothetical protein